MVGQMSLSGPEGKPASIIRRRGMDETTFLTYIVLCSCSPNRFGKARPVFPLPVSGDELI